MIINAKLIRHPVLIHHCDVCGKLITGQKIRLYGAAEQGDPPYVLYIHPYCATQEIKDALPQPRALTTDN